MVAKLWQIIRNNKAKAFIYKQIFHSKVLLKQRPKLLFTFSATNKSRAESCAQLKPYFLQFTTSHLLKISRKAVNDGSAY